VVDNLDTTATTIRIVIDDIWDGTKWQDMCISEVVIKGGAPSQGTSAAVARLAPEDEGFVDTRGGWGWGDRCFLHIKAGRLEAAKACCDRGLGMNPAPAVKGALLYNLGLIAQKSGDTTGASKYYADSLAARPGNATVQAALKSVR
jgi:tetratricopeptide (TPR) repeat protein